MLNKVANLFGRKKKKVRPLGERKSLDAHYYQTLHEECVPYQENNWLMGREDLLSVLRGRTVAELGCGNGRFTAQAAQLAEHVWAIDWAKSPLFDDSLKNITFLQGDARSMTFPEVDLFCSGDVLEHFAPEDVDPLIGKLDKVAKWNFHMIACYDDGHSHLTIEPAEWWLAVFRRYSADYRLISERRKRGKPVAIITNIPAQILGH